MTIKTIKTVTFCSQIPVPQTQVVKDQFLGGLSSIIIIIILFCFSKGSLKPFFAEITVWFFEFTKYTLLMMGTCVLDSEGNITFVRPR